MDKVEIKISIRNLIEFVLRSGDLDSKFVGAGRMLEGTKSHQKVQKAAGKAYNPEVYLTFSTDYKGFLITLEGRADGIIEETGGTVIDEIKSTTRPLESIDEDYNMMHWAQAKCYAYIYAVENGRENITVQLTYYHLDTEEKKCLRKSYSVTVLEQFFYGLIDKYLVFADLTKHWSSKRDASIKRLKFPFDAYRRGQRELAVAAYRTIEEGKKLFVQAPTGIGKTISTLFPAVKAVGEGHTSKIFYLTAKTITRQVAEEAFSRMRNRGLEFKTITLTAKDKICFNKGVSCTPEHCEFAKGHFDRVNDAIIDILSHEDNLTRETVEAYAGKYRVCPFEFALDLSLWVDCIICDYNYVFDPRVYLKRFFLNARTDYTFLIDEAHNLVDRAREMFSAEICKTAFFGLKKLLKGKELKLPKILKKINTFMVDLRKQCGEEGFLVRKEEQKDLYPLLKSFIKEAEDWLTKNQNAPGFEELLDLYFSSMAFVKIAEFYDERYVTFIEARNNEVKVKLFCLDPSYLLAEAVKRGKAAVFFSATLIPMDYHRYILGGNEEDYTIYLNSPFDTGNRCLVVADKISTRYRDRERSYQEIVEYIYSVISAKSGNYLVFFPSYQYMDTVFSRFTGQYPEVEAHCQSPIMTEEGREGFLGLFRENPEKTVLGFCVLGGIFSEGIDLKHDRLIGAMIVGVGLPQICLERDIIKGYFDERNSQGYEFAYTYPGMNKVLQAAGRVIRSETDKGIILLMDDRFIHQSYQSLFPREWFPYQTADRRTVQRVIDKFWRNQTC